MLILLERNGWAERSDGMLTSDKNNLDVAHRDLVRVELDEDPNLVGLMILTKEDKYGFSTSQNFADVSKLPTGYVGGQDRDSASLAPIEDGD
jgi:hypothetical protein